ncbi:DNA repair protein RAD51 [Diplocarpon rosae]|nr:DNA repair protein RAD51 [Diplocarpon rosae]
MEPTRPMNVYKETRLDLESPTPGCTVAIRLPAHGASTHSRTALKRAQIVELPVAEDENTFRQHHLASAAAIHYRTYFKSPRSFLWRVLEDGKVLSIRSVDISRSSNAAEANLTLRLSLPSAIRPGCIALADGREHDILSVFFLTETKQLYTLTLRPDQFRKLSSSEDNVWDWCKVYNSAGLGIKHPHRLVALGADELLISMTDGSQLRLARTSGGDGLSWKETHYNEGGWSLGSFAKIGWNPPRSLYGGQQLDRSTATSIASTLLASTGPGSTWTPFAFTICLDHRLRVWNLETGKLACAAQDILARDVEQSDQLELVIDASQSQLVRIINTDEGVVCVTLSPLGSNEFKFWSVTQKQNGSVELQDLFKGHKLVPQAPSATEIWTLADFSAVLNADRVTLWALWKNNVASRLRRLDFPLSSEGLQLQDAWRQNWLALADSNFSPSIPTILPGDSSDGTDKWLQFLLHPGRFTAHTLETCLAIYGRGLASSKSSARKSGTLPDRLCGTIAGTASLNRSSHGDMDYEQFRAAVDAQWRRFYRLLIVLDQQRAEAMSLSIDPEGRMPWIVMADGISAIRDCTSLECLLENEDSISPENTYVALPLFAAASFRQSLSNEFVHSCRVQMLEEIFQEPSLTPPARMRLFYEKCDFAGQIGDDQFNDLQSQLGGDFRNITLQVYSALLQLMNASTDVERPTVHPLAESGNKLLVKGVQDIVELHRSICLDQLILLVLIEYEVNQSDDGTQFETSAVFAELVTLLKSLERLNWLVSTEISVNSSRSGRSNAVTEGGSVSTKLVGAPRIVTILEGVLYHVLSLDLFPEDNLTTVVTEVLSQICIPNSRYESEPSLIQCFLLRHDRSDLAVEFSRFTEHDPFSTYIQGRAQLAANDPFAASAFFKKAAFGMGYPRQKHVPEYRSAGLLDNTERLLLNHGLPEYYSHIVALFEKEKNYSFVIDFARLALQFLVVKHGDVQASQLRTDMHSRLFNAAIQTSRYNVAHSIVCLFTDAALQNSSVRTLVTKMCELSSASQLIELPFLGLQDTVDDILAQKCQSIVDVNVGIPYHKILYAWRIRHSDFRGAAAISLERLQRLQRAGEGDNMLGEEGLETPVTKQYIALINALSCVDPKQAWILSEELPPKSSSAGVNAKKTPPKRHVVTLDEVRRAYQAELDRIVAIQNNQFAFGDGEEDEMDVL